MSCAGCVFAQDIISLRDGTNIENVKVQSISDSEVTYTQKNKTISISRNNVEAVLYGDGRFESLPRTPAYDASPIKGEEPYGSANEERQRSVLRNEKQERLWRDKSYSKECRYMGRKVCFKTYNKALKEALKEAKDAAVKAGNEAVRECNGGM